MLQVKRHYHQGNDQIVALCKISKELYNKYNLHMHQAWFGDTALPNINDLITAMHDEKCFKSLHNTKTAKQTIRKVVSNLTKISGKTTLAKIAQKSYHDSGFVSKLRHCHGGVMPVNSVTMESITSLVKGEVEKIEKLVKLQLKIVATITSRPSQNNFQLNFQLVTENTIIAMFNLNQLAGNCGIVVANASLVHSTYQHRGVGTILQHIKELIAKDAGYSQILATTNQDNQIQERIFAKYGWREVPMLAFRNKRTKNPIKVWAKHIA